ncbi:unnamed protein product [Meganyctiphanes norvegica]|uniref:Uncharacterized protein n=1 Tax=Meganyctiphanes norvegica TaxID=48144 RepID=A0AAV2SGE2_MEGNR
MQSKIVPQGWLAMSWLLLSLLININGAQENPVGVQQEVKLIETRADDHSDTIEPPRDKRFFTFSGFNGPQPFQPRVPFEALAGFTQQQNNFGGRNGFRNFANNFNQIGGRTGSRNNFAPDVIDTGSNNQNFNNFWSSPQFGNFNGRTGNRNNNNWSWGNAGDWSQWGNWPYGYGSWRQGNQSPWGEGGQWNQFGGRSVNGAWNQFGGPWGQFGGRSGSSGGYWPGYGYGYGYGFRK